ncbi:hypothetical protein [Reinekea sp. G2M2-21]|uniref:hypothetical protein n=1 Tax=Reinekea sp. G2M2-21 TaxID=2788942 RepID=UPI0018AA56C2|nr:hypothetical protein [Reinekea sp. G2M2-21]
MKRLLSMLSFAALMTVLSLGAAQAATVDAGWLGEISSEVTTTSNLSSGSETLVFAQAVNPSTSGFIANSGNDQWQFSPNDGASLTNVDSYYIRFDGAPALLGVPAETGTLTVGAGNVIEDVWTDRIYSRPVVFVSFEDPELNNGVSIVPTAPIMQGNQFLFDIRMADGFAADLEGATLNYLIAEEGWHRLADGRMLLISSAELRDTGFSGQTIELGATFQDAVSVAQLQRPMLYKNSLGFRQLNDMTVYQGATVTSGIGNISSIGLRMMQNRSVEEANGSTVYAGRVGFMVLGNLSELDNRIKWVKDTSTNIRGGSYQTVPLNNFTNYPHSAAVSPLLNKAACAEDDNVQNFCVYASMPVDTFSRSNFTRPRFPYIDADFQPLKMHRTMYSEHDNWDWTDVVSADMVNPTIDSDDTPITGTLAQLNVNFVADRGWDDWFFGRDFWHWFATYHYNTCTYNGVNTACVDYELGDTILNNHQLHWNASTTYDNYEEINGGHGAVWGEPPELTNEQKLFSVGDDTKRNRAYIDEYVSVPAWAANQAAAYLNYDVPEYETRHFAMMPESRSGNHNNKESWLKFYSETTNDWQLQSMTLKAWGTEWFCGTCGNTDFGDYFSSSIWWFSVPFRSFGTNYSVRHDYIEKHLHVKPVVDKVTRNFRVGDFLFANVHWSLDTSDYRWVRSATEDIDSATTVATNVFGYQAAADDANQFLTFCMTYKDIERCGDWFEVGNVPYVTDVHVTPEFSEPVAGSGLLGQHTYLAPDEGTYSQESQSLYQWQTLTNTNWTDIVGATENTIDVYIAAGTQVRFCVTPRSLEGITGPELCSSAVVMQGDNDGDGYSDDWDSDDDNDGKKDWFDAFPFDNSEWLDTDGDGIGNNADTDDDNDGISDDDENAGLTDPLKYDTDGDGTNDFDDPQPTSYGNFPDFDNDGLDDTVDEDRDNDGVIDFVYQIEGTAELQTLVTEDDVVLAWARIDDDPYNACVANQITVTSNADSGPGTLRQALADLCASDPAGDLNTITFSEPMTIALESPLLITKGLTIDGTREVVIDGQNATSLFEVSMTDKLMASQFPNLVGLTLRHGLSQQTGEDAESDYLDNPRQASVIEMHSASYLMLDFTLVEHVTAPAINGEHYKLYMNNSLIANVSGSDAALMTTDGQLNLSSSTLYNSEGGALTVLGDGSANLRNSLLLNGPTGSTACQVSSWTQQTASWVEGSECGISSTGYVALADPENGDYRPIPGSANIEAGPRDIDPDSVDVDLLGNDRIMGEYNPDNPEDLGGPIFPYIDIGAIEYDFYGDFDGDGVANTNDAFPDDDTETTDTDGDGHGDNSDAFINDDSEWLDTDGDNIGNNADTDDDGDGYSDSVELDEGTDSLDSASVPADFDGDLIPDSTDVDDDNDGVEDINDAFPFDASQSAEPDSGDSGTGDKGDASQDEEPAKIGSFGLFVLLLLWPLLVNRRRKAA